MYNLLEVFCNVYENIIFSRILIACYLFYLISCYVNYQKDVNFTLIHVDLIIGLFMYKNVYLKYCINQLTVTCLKGPFPWAQNNLILFEKGLRSWYKIFFLQFLNIINFASLYVELCSLHSATSKMNRYSSVSVSFNYLCRTQQIIKLHTKFRLLYNLLVLMI